VKEWKHISSFAPFRWFFSKRGSFLSPSPGTEVQIKGSAFREHHCFDVKIASISLTYRPPWQVI
jgi:hypothetical protein